MVNVQPKSIVCTTTQTVKLRCKVKNVEDPLPKFIWNQYLNGVHIRRLHGEDHYHVSVLSIAYCSYQDLGNYSCTVACNGRNMTSIAYVIVQGSPVVIKQDVMADSSNVTLAVTYITEPPLMYILWYINDEIVKESNSSNQTDIFIQNIKVNVPVNYHQTSITRNVHQNIDIYLCGSSMCWCFNYHHYCRCNSQKICQNETVRQIESPEEDDASETLNPSQYAEIDDVSYHSVTWRDYSLDNVQEYTEMNAVVNNPTNLNTQCYKNIRDSLRELRVYDFTSTNENRHQNRQQFEYNFVNVLFQNIQTMRF
ncbi:unnamed protein product [Mytilus edulis]|uniref:Ig-like domain-containing protein n=1 Tax=Mytilus edulis TaxID=6550 RepID=A0A8S3S979_MYTED|nr:unnamed protein product [Mytilus edulis]